jgi:uncharacterized membrane protein YgcG
VKRPKAPKEDPSAAVLRARQITDLAKLDEQQNTRIKRMFNAARGSRIFRGSPSGRVGPGNAAGSPLFSPRGTGGGGGTSGGGTSGGGTSGGGTSGGGTRGGGGSHRRTQLF